MGLGIRHAMALGQLTLRRCSRPRQTRTFAVSRRNFLAGEAGPGGKASGHFTPITKQLWVDRLATVQQHQSDTVNTPITHKPPEETRVVYPFSSNPGFKEMYRNPWNMIRIGCILEDLDSLAGNIAFQHCSRPGSPPPLLVTAAVDEIHLRRPIAIEQDITMTGQVAWTGTSALDIQMKLWQQDDRDEYQRDDLEEYIPHEQQQPSLVAMFSFVHLDPVTRKPSPTVQLAPQTEEEKELAARRQVLADARRSARKQMTEGGWSVLQSPEASKWMQPLLKEARSQVDLPALGASDTLPIPVTALENTFTTVPQQQNMHGRVFGGFLMRRGFELAFATAYMFAGHTPEFLKVDEMSFKRPVDVGNLLRFKSRVLYTHLISQRTLLIFVEVDAKVVKPEQHEVANTNTFTFVFSVDPTVVLHPIKRVLPTNEEEGQRAYECYLAAKALG